KAHVFFFSFPSRLSGSNLRCKPATTKRPGLRKSRDACPSSPPPSTARSEARSAEVAHSRKGSGMLPRFPIGTASHKNVSRCGALVKWHERAAAWHKMGTEACDKGRKKSSVRRLLN